VVYELPADPYTDSSALKAYLSPVYLSATCIVFDGEGELVPLLRIEGSDPSRRSTPPVIRANLLVCRESFVSWQFCVDWGRFRMDVFFLPLLPSTSPHARTVSPVPPAGCLGVPDSILVLFSISH